MSAPATPKGPSAPPAPPAASAASTQSPAAPLPPASAPPPPSVATMLSDDALALLRKGYQPAAMLAASGRTLTTLFPKAAQYIDAVMAEYVGGDDLAPPDRERCIITILTLQDARGTLAAHLYWGLMEGLSPVEIANTLLLAGAYAGVPHFAAALFTFRTVLEQLAGLAAKGGDAVQSPSVLKALLEAFR